MKFLSLCSGIEAASVAWNPLGWEPIGFSEIEKFPNAVLNYRYPSVPNFGDMTKFKEWKNDLAFDLLVGGTPCQSFSVAGLRKGLDDARGNLALTYCSIAEKYKPRWLVWENVPGVLSADKGTAFASFVTALGEIGYHLAYRVLDAQYFGLPHRRKRIFVVGYLGDWRPATAVLFEPNCGSGNTKTSRKKRESSSTDSQKSFGNDGKKNVVTYDFYQITAPINRQNRQDGDPCHTLARDNAAYAHILQSDNDSMSVRKLTPTECERLQGFPDNYTKIPYGNKDAENCPDLPRYKAIGNSMAVPVMSWIGKRIALWENLNQ